MRDRIPILAGLLLFVALFMIPVWRGVLARTAPRAPELTLPAGRIHCVLPREQMRQMHMQLLIGWREAKVRDGQTMYTAYDGQQYRMSLTATCLRQCHTNKAEFCDRCHQYAAVSGPYCFDCHVDPSRSARATAGLAENSPIAAAASAVARSAP
jgi:hypothetical protein